MSAMEFREPNEVLWRGVRPAHRGVQILANDAKSDGTTILHTVPVGKTFYLCDCSVTVDCGIVQRVGRLDIRDAEDAVISTLVRCVTSLVQAYVFTPSYWPPIEIPAGYDVVITSNSASLVIYAFIHGWEE